MINGQNVGIYVRTARPNIVSVVIETVTENFHRQALLPSRVIALIDIIYVNFSR